MNRIAAARKQGRLTSKFHVSNGVCFGRLHSFCPSFPPLIVLPLCARSIFAHPTGLKHSSLGAESLGLIIEECG